MNEPSETSLHLAFDETHTRVVLRTTEHHQPDLVQLAARFRTGGQLGLLSASVALDDFLANLQVLGDWPDSSGVEWSSALRKLATGVLQDARTVETRLAGTGSSGEVDADDVPSLLGDNWKGELSAFQRRDIAKLLSLQHGANFSVPGSRQDARRARRVRGSEGCQAMRGGSWSFVRSRPTTRGVSRRRSV